MSSFSVLQKESDQFFTGVQVHLKFRDRVFAGIPKQGDPLDYFIESKHMSDAQKADFQERIKAGDLPEEEKEAVKETSWCVFEKNPDGNLCLWHNNIKAMLREIFVVQGLTARRPKAGKKAEGENQAENASAGGRQTFQHAVCVDPLWTPFTRDGKFFQKADGCVDRIKHIQDAAGKRSAIGRHDYLEKIEMDFILKWPRKGVFTVEDIRMALAAAQEDGLGACRSQGIGKFDVTEFTELK